MAFHTIVVEVPDSVPAERVESVITQLLRGERTYAQSKAAWRPIVTVYHREYMLAEGDS